MMLSTALTADEVIRRLGLAPHPEGGFYRQTFRDARCDASGRAVSTAIYYLLPSGQVSAWHRVDAAEVWHFYAGAPLAITLSEDGEAAVTRRLGPDILNGEEPQLVVPGGCWQTATSLGAWTLVGCTVAPGFLFDRFEMAPLGWRPTPRVVDGGVP
jgi:predicted cupin superfamily sugar epimerase